MGTMCGFPSVIMEGSVDDWRLLRQNAERLIRNRCQKDFSDWCVQLCCLSLIFSCWSISKVAQARNSPMSNSGTPCVNVAVPLVRGHGLGLMVGSTFSSHTYWI